MPIDRPTTEQLTAIASRYGFGLDADAIAEYAPLVEASFDAWDAVEQLYAKQAPTAPDRKHWTPEDNPLGAWYVRCEIATGDEGPLSGRTVAVKDNVMVAGVPMMNGSRTVEGFIPVRDATVVSRLLAAGATIAGKSTCEDLCFSGGSHTTALGPVRNPWDTNRSAGGSSSGSAALVSSGGADLAVGGDQGGSIRIPSAYCGVVGHKPTHGLVPYTGAFPIELTIDHLGPITRTVRDAAVMLQVMAGPDGLDARQPDRLNPDDYVGSLDQGVDGLRIGVLQEGFGIPGVSQSGVDDAVRATIERLRSVGAKVEEVSVPWHTDAMALWAVIATEGATWQMIEGNAYGLNYPGEYDPELIAHFAKGRRAHGAELSETLKATALGGRHALDVSYGQHYAMARNLALEARKAYDEALDRYDVLMLPTLPITATELPAPNAPVAERVARGLEMLANTAPFDVTGHPATSVPAGPVDGLPAAAMIVGKRFDDATCLRVAHAVEQLDGGFPMPTSV
ncbi:amidase [Nitriliruptor alkaliphilus]|uniref:amidase n=1 Tax=Nitriliruptor alkaliphilus TaxID=427918 RepID=UPI0006989695|nr:amidase [Nitriliruptor alkaliphilus]